MDPIALSALFLAALINAAPPGPILLLVLGRILSLFGRNGRHARQPAARGHFPIPG